MLLLIPRGRPAGFLLSVCLVVSHYICLRPPSLDVVRSTLVWTILSIHSAQQFHASYSQQLTRLMQREEGMLAQVCSSMG